MSSTINRSYLFLLILVAALGGMLFGFDIAIITGAGPFFELEFDLNKIQLGWAFSSLLAGCVVGSAVAGRITDTLGRKTVMIWVAILFAITSVATALAPGFELFVIARILGGLAVGGASMVAPMYISEVAPSKVRGSLVSVYQLSIVLGIVISYLINYLLHDIGENNWRWMFATGVIPSVIFLIMLFFVPETPRFLYKKGRKDQAFDILKKINGEDAANLAIKEISESITDKKTGYSELLKPKHRKMMIVGIGLAIFVQISGINAIVDYAPVIFKTAGWNIDTALFATFGLGIVNVSFTFISIWAIDKFGRKPLYLIGSAGMTLATLALTIFSGADHFKGIAVLICIMVFIAFFASCIGPVFWTLVSEIFPNYIRGTAMSVPVFTQWFFNVLVVLAFPAMMHNFQTLTFAFMALMGLLQLLFTLKFVPETKGKTLEQIEKSWN